MNVVLNRLDPSVPDPVESRRRAAGRLVRAAYSTIVFGMLAFFVIYFGRPLVYLGGSGLVSSPMVVVSSPYVVQVKNIRVVRGSVVEAGEAIAQVWSPEQDNIVANYMRGLAEVAGRSAELRIKQRVAQESLAAARSYVQVTEEAVNRVVEASGSATTAFRMEVFRERAVARKALVSLEAEAAEAATQLASLDELSRQIREHLDDVERNFSGGRIVAPIAGIIPTRPARAGQSVLAGSPIAEIRDPSDIYVYWYIPNERFADPRVGREVAVLFGNWRIFGTIIEIMPVSDADLGTQAGIARERVNTQIARIRLHPGQDPPAFNSTVHVRMYYTGVAAGVFAFVQRIFGLHG